MRHHPDPVTGNRPAGTRVYTVTVDCGSTGPEELDLSGCPYRLYTLKDVEAWCAELRRLGAAGDLVLSEADGLTVAVDVRC